MTADPAIYPATLLPGDPSCRRPDPVRARVSAGQQLVNSQGFPAHSSRNTTDSAHLIPPLDYRAGAQGKPHPGDVLYWVACLGGACLLLIKATT